MKPYTIKTYMCKEFDFDKTDPEAIDIRDIAHALSHLCRFTGHTNIFYSVAQHCLLVAEKIHGGPEVKLAALLHDAAEAYVNDLSSPLRKWLAAAYVEGGGMVGGPDPKDEPYSWQHDDVLKVIYKKYGVTESEVLLEEVKAYDQAACRFEQEAFMGAVPTGIELWSLWNPAAYAASIAEGEFGLVEAEFLKRFEDLMTACGRGHLL